MTDDILVVRILKHVVEECYYERMLGQGCKDIDKSMSYNQFLAWNKKCIEELSYEDLNWTWGLCNRLPTIGTMDMEECDVWKADSFYYDTAKQLVIVHPR